MLVEGKGPETLPLLMTCPKVELAELYIRFGATVDNLPFNLCFDMFGQSNLRFLEFLVK